VHAANFIPRCLKVNHYGAILGMQMRCNRAFCRSVSRALSAMRRCDFDALMRYPVELRGHGTQPQAAAMVRLWLCVGSSRARRDVPKRRLPRSLSQPYSGSPAVRSATPRAPASSGAQFTPENCRLNRNVGCNSKTCAAADLASSSRPSFASVAAKST
jgi:hypothetical protein